ncbi:AAA family ATPase [Gordonia alkanivorans]|nr:AAA family ATPase [Gordonia alkanivorans]QGP89141.1 AAA family ATPase [Gordonia sp. 135]
MPEVAEVRLRAAAMHTDARRQIDALARTLTAQREAAVVPPVPVTLADLLAQPDDTATYRIEELWPTGGRILLAAQYKSGKSTMVGNVLRTLVDGGQFLDRFDVSPVGKVAVIDTELDTRTLRRWLREQSIENTDRVSVLPLRGAVSAFDILDPATRSRWAAQLADAEVVILDCLRPVLDALGLSEDKDAGRVLVAFDALLAEIGASEGVVVTHMGHQNERARGDSRLLDWPDALWKIVRGGDDTNDDGSRARYFSAVGRDVSVPEGCLTFDRETRHLTYADGTAAIRPPAPPCPS